MTLMTFEHVLFIFLYKTEMKHTILIKFLSVDGFKTIVSPTVSFLMTLMKTTGQSLSGIETCFLNKENKLSSGTL